MNEKIKELAEQAGITDNNLSDGGMSTADLKKFAELIVEECARDFDKTYMSGGETMGNYIRRKFGVEE